MNKTIIDILSDKIKEKPDSPLFLSLASEYKKQDRLDEAIDILLEGLKSNPNYIPARVMLAQLYKENNMDSEYIKELEKILLREPQNINVRKMLAQHFSSQGMMQEAINSYEEILRYKPDDLQSLNFIKQNKIKESDLQDKDTVTNKLEIPEGIDESKSNLTINPSTDIEFKDELLQIDKLSAEKRYKEALMICDTILISMPSNRKILQKKEELKFLLKLINRPKELAIKRLRKFKIALIKLYFRARLENE
ncbi:MAG: hypothetical protein N2738_09005 [Thermodesulfovibrionales bacterium]|nr:hypothetical protein [Thermodesulfovibrionales bacterium]